MSGLVLSQLLCYQVRLSVRSSVHSSFYLLVTPFVHLSFSHPIRSSVCLSVRSSIRLFIRSFVHLSVRPSICPFLCSFVQSFFCVCSSGHSSFCLFVPSFIHLSVLLPFVLFSVHSFNHTSACSFVLLSVRPSIRPSVYSSVHSSFCLFVRPFVNLSITIRSILLGAKVPLEPTLSVGLLKIVKTLVVRQLKNTSFCVLFFVCFSLSCLYALRAGVFFRDPTTMPPPPPTLPIRGFSGNPSI